MAPLDGLPNAAVRLVSRSANGTSALDGGAYNQHVWSGGLNIASVDLIAMIISDAGLASTEPKWWNASPLGCLLLGAQPRGGWQVLQRAVQWGEDSWAHCFGVDCKVPLLYSYFACSIRNRLEVWKSDNFLSPMLEHTEPAALDKVQAATTESSNEEQAVLKEVADKEDPLPKAIDVDVEKGATPSPPTASPQLQPMSPRTSISSSGPSLFRKASSQPKPEKQGDVAWKRIERGIRGTFDVGRPTKLLDGGRGGQAFMCDILLPGPGKAYSVEEQARMQLLSVILVVAGTTHCDDPDEFLAILHDDFDLTTRLGSVFNRLLPCLILANLFVIGLTTSVFYALWYHNIYGRSVPYVIQLCSLASWAAGAVGLLMLGGNPRVVVSAAKPAPKHVQDRLDAVSGDYVKVQFGSLHGSVFVQDRGSCHVPNSILQTACRWRIRLTRSWFWYASMQWFVLFLLLSIVLQIAGSKIATIKSEIMSIVILVLASVLRGAGLSGPEKWMIPYWKRRDGARYAVKLQGQIESRASATAT